MASALSKEMGMMEIQLNRWKQIANESHSLREEAESLKASLCNKVSPIAQNYQIFIYS